MLYGHTPDRLLIILMETNPKLFPRLLDRVAALLRREYDALHEVGEPQVHLKSLIGTTSLVTLLRDKVITCFRYRLRAAVSEGQIPVGSPQ